MPRIFNSGISKAIQAAWHKTRREEVPKRSFNAEHQIENGDLTQKIAEAHAIHKGLKEKEDVGDFVLQMIVEQSKKLE